MCGEVSPEHSSPDTDVYGALTDAGEATAMGVRGNPRHMLRGNRVGPASVQSRLDLVVDASGNVSHGVRLLGSPERRGPAGKALRSRCVSPLLARYDARWATRSDMSRSHPRTGKGPWCSKLEE
jgi:hypothetical protein